MLNCQVVTKKLPQMKQSTYSLKIIKKLKAFDSIYFRGKSHFEEDGAQNYLVFQPIKIYFKVTAGSGNLVPKFTNRFSRTLHKICN